MSALCLTFASASRAGSTEPGLYAWGTSPHLPAGSSLNAPIVYSAVAAGGNHTLALKPDGTVIGWGDNTFGQNSPPPGLTTVTAIAVGADHSAALRADGTVVVWGSNV